MTNDIGQRGRTTTIYLLDRQLRRVKQWPHGRLSQVCRDAVERELLKDAGLGMGDMWACMLLNAMA